ncbi:MAG TPA: PQQ-dependent sugar dehydrogenase, partial [Thermoplasmata archaeon]|nr:PQQ-dependent sugar dehydrogenase [Thermoplasmata archaeon]
MRLAVAATAVLAILFLSNGVTASSSRIVPAEIAVKTILSGLEWPVAIDFAPDGRLFYGELLTGRVRILSGGALLETPFYAFEDAVFFGERGLLGLALHPAFETDPWVYVYYTYNDATDGRDYNRIARVWANGDVGEFHEVILDRIPGALNHNGGVIGFGPDGMLYALVGDTEDPANAQNLSSQSGKVLRMTPEGAVPSDNPFSEVGGADPYVFTFGHRNMFGLAHHPVTSQLYVTENGPFCNDEVNLLVPGANYGWGPNWTCGTPPEPPANTNQDGPEATFPVFLYDTVVAPTNAILYSGVEFPDWEGDMIAGEWNTGKLRRLVLEPPGYDVVVGEEVIHTAPSGILDLEIAPDGAIWFT